MGLLVWPVIVVWYMSDDTYTVPSVLIIWVEKRILKGVRGYTYRRSF